MIQILPSVYYSAELSPVMGLSTFSLSLTNDPLMSLLFDPD